MSVAKEWRDHASRLLARAAAARERGDTELADLLTMAARQYTNRAAEVLPPISEPDAQPEPQSKKNKDSKE
jgi:hypothetical protein